MKKRVAMTSKGLFIIFIFVSLTKACPSSSSSLIQIFGAVNCDVEVNGKKVSTNYVFTKNGDKCTLNETIVTTLPTGKQSTEFFFLNKPCDYKAPCMKVPFIEKYKYQSDFPDLPKPQK